MGEVGDQLDPAGRQDRVEVTVDELLRSASRERLDAARRERRAHEAADPGVVRWVGLGHPDREVLVERSEPARLPARRPLDDPGHPVRAREPARVADRQLDVLGAGEQPAAPGLDPVDRRLLAQATEDRVRIGDELGRREEVVEPGVHDGHPSESTEPADRASAKPLRWWLPHQEVLRHGQRDPAQPPPGLLRHDPDDVPRRRDLEVDLDAIRRHVRFLIDGGLTTGQRGPARRRSGRRLLDADLRRARRRSPRRSSTRPPGASRSRWAARRRAPASSSGSPRPPSAIGADYLQVSPPFYFEHTEGDFEEHILAAADAADVGLIIYNTFWTSLGLSSAMVERLADDARTWSASSGRRRTTATMTFEQIVSRFSDRFAIIDNQMRYVTSHILGARSIEVHVAQLLAAVGRSACGRCSSAASTPRRSARWHGSRMPFMALWSEMEALHQRRRLPRQAVHGAGRARRRAASGRRPATSRPLFREKARQMLLDCGVPGVVA